MIRTYVWDFGDGGTAVGREASHAYAKFGTYTARLIVTDDNVPPQTATNTVSISVSLGNQPPVANPGGPYLIDSGDGVTLNGSDSTDANLACGDEIASYHWSINDGQILATGAAPALSSDQVEVLGTGVFSVHLTVTDSFGATGQADTTLGIYDNQPIAVLHAIPNPAACGQSILFDASSSFQTRPDRMIRTYVWDFGDGGTAVGREASHAYATFGTYTARLIVTDDNVPPQTATNTASISVSLGNQPPVANPGGPYLLILNETGSLDGSSSTDPNTEQGDLIVSYHWNVDNGRVQVTGINPVFTPETLDHLGVGEWLVQLTVTDSLGQTNMKETFLEIVSRPKVESITLDTEHKQIYLMATQLPTGIPVVLCTSTNLMSWEAIQTNYAGKTGQMEFIVPWEPMHARRFFRLTIEK
jgi:PKD repeat protein